MHLLQTDLSLIDICLADMLSDNSSPESVGDSKSVWNLGLAKSSLCSRGKDWDLTRDWGKDWGWGRVCGGAGGWFEGWGGRGGAEWG